MIKHSKTSGLAQIPLIIGLVIMAIAVPVATKLVEQGQDTRKSAAGDYECCVVKSGAFAGRDGKMSKGDSLRVCNPCSLGGTCSGGVCSTDHVTSTPDPRPNCPGRCSPAACSEGEVTLPGEDYGDCSFIRENCCAWPENVTPVETVKPTGNPVSTMRPVATVKPVTSIEPIPTILVQGECMTPDDCPVKAGFRLDSCSGSPRKCRYVSLVVNPTSASGSGRLNPTSEPGGEESKCGNGTWCTSQAECANSCGVWGVRQWSGGDNWCQPSDYKCCECNNNNSNENNEPVGSSSSVWFNGTVMEAGNRWMDKKRKDDGTAKHDWPSQKIDCANKVGVGFDVSRNVRLGWIEDDNGGHFDMRVYKDREFTVILQPPTECGLTCGAWKVFDRGDNLENADNPMVVAEGTGCGLTFMPKTDDWQSGIEFSLVPISTATSTLIPTLTDEGCNRLGGADLAEMELWRTDYVAGQMGDIQKADWAGDFNCDGYVDIDDREIWREAYMLNLLN